MQGLVCNHPQTISNTREASYFRALVEAFALGQLWFGAHTCDYFDDRESFTAFHRRLVAPYFDHVLSRFGTGPESIVVQKEPRMTEFFPEVAHLLEGARFLVMFRDLRDVVASQFLRAKREDRKYSLQQDVGRYLRTLHKLTAHRDVLAGRLMFVRYEGLVSRPSVVMEQVWRFLDLPPIMVDENTRWTAKRPPTDESASEFDGAPPVVDPIGRNRHLLDRLILSELDRVRDFVKARIGLDPFVGGDVKSDGPSTFFLDDMVPAG